MNELNNQDQIKKYFQSHPSANEEVINAGLELLHGLGYEVHSLNKRKNTDNNNNG